MKWVKYFLCYLFANTIGLLAYDRKYYTGRYFKKFAIGWSWVVKCFFWQKVAGFNSHVPWPVSPRVIVGNPRHIHFDPDDLHMFHTSGTYFQAQGANIYIGKGTYIAPNVGLITSNHDPQDIDTHIPGEDINIGEKCWVGMNAVILPGVSLGKNTVVGAGAVVTHSFPDGYCMLAGVPARLIKKIDPLKIDR
jgi:hypothetical protein